MHEVLLERAAERDLKALSLAVYERIVSHLKALSQNPRPAGCKKISGSRSDWRIRIGDYRVIYEIDDRGKPLWGQILWGQSLLLLFCCVGAVPGKVCSRFSRNVQIFYN